MRNSQVKVKSKKHALVLAACVGLVVIASTLLYTHQTHKWLFAHATIDPNSVRQQTAHPSPKNNNPPTKQSDTAPQTGSKTSDQVPINATLEASIDILQENNNQINFSATVQNATMAGTCVVTFSNPNDRPVTKQFTSTNANSVSTCQTTVSTLEFSYLGVWQVSFHYYSGTTQATSQGTITIK